MSIYEDIYAFENVYAAYQRARRGRRYKRDILLYEQHLEKRLSALCRLLKTERYRHGPYREFVVNDSKKRTISATSFQDRIVHHAVYAQIEPPFEKRFIHDSYVCRRGKGSHRAVKQVRRYMYGVTDGYKKRAHYLKMDVAKYFHTIDHIILKQYIYHVIHDKRTQRLISLIIDSRWDREKEGRRTGIPIGNLTSQLFANVYLNPLDHFIKEQLKCRYYVRYMDDFVICHKDRDALIHIRNEIERFTTDALRLSFHPHKVLIKPVRSGISFLGYVLYPRYTALRRSTVRRCKKRIVKYKRRGVSKEAIIGPYMAWRGYASYAQAWRQTQNIWKDIIC